MWLDSSVWEIFSQVNVNGWDILTGIIINMIMVAFSAIMGILTHEILEEDRDNEKEEAICNILNAMTARKEAIDIIHKKKSFNTSKLSAEIRANNIIHRWERRQEEAIRPHINWGLDPSGIIIQT